MRMFVRAVLAETDEAVYHLQRDNRKRRVRFGCHVFGRVLAKRARRRHPGSCSERG